MFLAKKKKYKNFTYFLFNFEKYLLQYLDKGNQTFSLREKYKEEICLSRDLLIHLLLIH